LKGFISIGSARVAFGENSAFKEWYHQHPALKEAWRFLDEKKDESGRFVLDWTMPKCSLTPGKKDFANKWVPLYAYLAMKHRNLPQETAVGG